MAIQYVATGLGNGHSYLVAGGAADRPAAPVELSTSALLNFCETPYARDTTLSAFLRAHPNAAARGVLNALHRRHIISWNRIQQFCAACAKIYGPNPTGTQKEVTHPVFIAFDVNPADAIALPHGAARANGWFAVAKEMCWKEQNIFIGPSSGNHGTDIDLGQGMTDAERQQLLAGTPWQSMNRIEGNLIGTINGAA